MFERRVRAALALAAVTGVVFAPAQAAGAAAPAPKQDYIVVFERSVGSAGAATDARERALGFRSRHRYAHALKGFAASLSPRQVERLEADPAVEFVAPDRPVAARETVAANELVPAGVRRIEAATATEMTGASSAAVAIIDTGVDLTHPDLAGNVVDGKNCVDPAKSAQDDHGHGTHVAGTVAAANDGGGVVGVAAGTRVVAVKVLGADGSGLTSGVVCGIDWVTANAPALGIRVANMSLGGSGAPVRSCSETSDPQHRAICRSTAAGVAYVAAAGNDGVAFDSAAEPDVPAAYPEVVTVTSVNDTDGLAGGAGAKCSREPDDRYSGFSNFASTSAAEARTIAAPGGCVTSSRLGGGTRTLSGTSMAAPHAAGAMALCIGRPGAPGPCATLTARDAAALARELTENREPAYGFGGDPHQPVTGRHYGYLLWAAPASFEGSALAGPAPDSEPEAPAETAATGDSPAPAPSEQDVPADAPAPAPSPDPTAPVSTPAPVTGPALTLTHRRVRLRTALRRGLRVRVTTRDAAGVKLALVLPGRTARTLKLTRTIRAMTVARATRSLEGGQTTTFVLRFTRAARRALIRRATTRLRLRATAVDATGGRQTGARLVILRR